MLADRVLVPVPAPVPAPMTVTAGDICVALGILDTVKNQRVDRSAEEDKAGLVQCSVEQSRETRVGA